MIWNLYPQCLILADIVIFILVNVLHTTDGATSVAPPASTTTDLPTTTGTVFPADATEKTDDDIEFTDPLVYGPVAGAAGLLAVGGVIGVVVLVKKGVIGAGGATSSSVAPRSTAMVKHATKTKISRTKVKPIKVQQMGDRQATTLSIIRVQRTTLDIHAITESKV